MVSLRAWIAGLGRVWRAPTVLAGVWLATLLAAFPAAVAVGSAIHDHLGSSLAADRAADSVNYDWWQAFTSEASGAASTFDPSILGFAAPLRNLSDVADGLPPPASVAATIAAFLVFQIFLTGGIVERYARDPGGRGSSSGRSRMGSYEFLVACSTFFFRLLRLGLFALVMYATLVVSVRPSLTALYRTLTLDVSVEREAFAIYAATTGSYVVLLAAVNLLFDFAKIRLVTEDRRSAFGALVAGLRFILRHPFATTGLYLLNVIVFAAILAIYFAAAPSPAASGWHLAAALAGMQLFILSRIAARLVFVASETALFQSRLAHAGYVARKVPPRPVPAAIQ
jgi:hypothetical protein